MILDKFPNFSGSAPKQTWALKANFLGNSVVLPQQQDRTRCALSRVRPAGDIQTCFQRVAAMPGFVCKLERRPNLQLVAIPGPRVEEVAAPTFRSNQHVFGSLAVRVAVESCVAEDRVKESTGT